LEDKIKGQRYAVQQATGSAAVGPRTAKPIYLPRHLLRAWPEVRARILAASRRALFLDFDGTLVKLRNHPDAVRLSKRTKATLERLARRENLFVALVSGRSLRFLQTVIGGNRIACIGVHGGESKEKSVDLSKKARQALRRAKRIARLQLRDFPSVWIEDKRLSFAVHYRGARRATAVACPSPKLYPRRKMTRCYVCHGVKNLRCDPKLWRESCRQVFPSRVRDAYGPRGSNEHTPRATASDAFHSLQ